MRYTTKTEYGLICLIYIGRSSGQKPITIKEMSNAEQYSQAYVEKILQSLRGADIVRAEHGNQGGYVLAKPASDITLKEFTVLLFSKLTTLPTGAAAFDGGRKVLVANTPTFVPFNFTAPDTTYRPKLQAWDLSTGDEALVNFLDSSKTQTGLTCYTVVNAVLYWEIIL